MKTIFIGFVLFSNGVAYMMMWYDKRQAVSKRRRVPESRLFVIALLMGAPGIYLGMKKPLYHKAAKSIFRFGIPLLIVANAYIAYLLWYYYFTRTRL